MLGNGLIILKLWIVLIFLSSTAIDELVRRYYILFISIPAVSSPAKSHP
jgi:hypothetical protein